MTDKCVLYATRYGASKNFAMHLAQQKNYSFFSIKEKFNTQTCEELIFVAPLYNGKVLGLAELINKLGNQQAKKLTVIIVGSTNPAREEFLAKMSQKVQDQLAPTALQFVACHYLLGEINVAKLNFVHKTLMNLLYKQAKKKATAEQTAMETDLMQAYEAENGLDYSQLAPLLATI